MTDKIDNIASRLVGTNERKAAAIGKRADATATSARGRGMGSGDSVKVTRTAQQLAQLEAVLRETPDIREERVAALRQQIADGDYAVNADRVAERLLQSEAQLMPAPARKTAWERND